MRHECQRVGHPPCRGEAATLCPSQRGTLRGFHKPSRRSRSARQSPAADRPGRRPPGDQPAMLSGGAAANSPPVPPIAARSPLFLFRVVWLVRTAPAVRPFVASNESQAGGPQPAPLFAKQTLCKYKRFVGEKTCARSWLNQAIPGQALPQKGPANANSHAQKRPANTNTRPSKRSGKRQCSKQAVHYVVGWRWLSSQTLKSGKAKCSRSSLPTAASRAASWQRSGSRRR